ncbi:MAG: SIS domain-containing protein [Candidatus Nanoarchaeia archaeon]|nr:SIS domain-containing protein [Candidatus Nanoarchaeia archaeon]
MEEDKKFFLKYYQELSAQITNIDSEQLEKAIDILRKAKNNGNTIYICGNGGSASTSEHWANDLMKIAGVKAQSLTTLPLITAYGNDISYESIFVEQLKILMKEGDVVIGITGSGNSPNIVSALGYALQNGGIPLAILGFNGGKIINMNVPFILIKSRDYGIIEDMHLSLGHVFAKILGGKDVVVEIN